MRVTSQTLPASLTSNLQRLAQKQYQLQNETATGKKSQALEEDPRAIQRLITLQADAKSITQYQRNAESSTQKINETNTLLRSLRTLSSRASEIAIKADPIIGIEGLGNYATEIDSLLEDALAQANHEGTTGFSFSGTRSDQTPFVPSRDQDGRITSVSYQGNLSETLTDIGPEFSVSTSTIGENNTDSGPPGLFKDQRSGADFFAHLISLRDHLAAGDIESVQKSDIPAIEADEDNFLFHLSAAGSLQSRIETTQRRLSDQSFEIAAENSRLTDADLAETIVSLNQAQTAYQAALQSGAQILSSSLMDYLR